MIIKGTPDVRYVIVLWQEFFIKKMFNQGNDVVMIKTQKENPEEADASLALLVRTDA